MTTPLLIIDMLNDFFQQPALAARRNQLVSSTNDLIEVFRSASQPVIWIRQEFRADLTDAFLEMRKENINVVIEGTAGACILSGLDVRPNDFVIIKKRYSAFFGTKLDEVLAGIETKRLVVGGINTHACVRTTVIDAYQRDYDVIIASDCTASYDEEHHNVTKRYLDGAIAMPQ
jgi:nicotinamidase-related amidase